MSFCLVWLVLVLAFGWLVVGWLVRLFFVFVGVFAGGGGVRKDAEIERKREAEGRGRGRESSSFFSSPHFLVEKVSIHRPITIVFLPPLCFLTGRSRPPTLPTHPSPLDSLVDSLDTLWLMGLKDEFWEGRDYVRDKLRFDHVGDVSFFETTIRNLGGLLSAYDLSRDVSFLNKADDLGLRLSRAYDTPSGMPHGSVHLGTGRSNK